MSLSAGVPQSSVVGPFFFLIFIDDLTENVASGVELAVDNTSLLSVVQKENEIAQSLNGDL